MGSIVRTAHMTGCSMRYLTILSILSCVLVIKGDSKVEFTEDYSVHERPPTKEGEPVLIEASINLRNILDVAEKEQIISLETTLRLYFRDERIKPAKNSLDSEDLIGRYVT